MGVTKVHTLKGAVALRGPILTDNIVTINIHTNTYILRIVRHNIFPKLEYMFISYRDEIQINATVHMLPTLLTNLLLRS